MDGFHQVVKAGGFAFVAGQGAFDALGRSLGGATQGTRRAAMHGLRAAIAEGSREAVEVAVSSVSADTVGERRQAVGALGNPQASISRAAIDALLGALDDEDDLVRSNAAYSLGQLFRASPEDPDRLLEGLLARLRSGVEPDNATNGGWARSTVRESAAFALLQAANNGHIGAHRVEALEDIARNDPDRYVRPMAREALARR